MTRYLSEPIEPFAVPARILRSSNGNDPPAGGGGRGSEGDHSGSGEPPRLPEGWNPAVTTDEPEPFAPAQARRHARREAPPRRTPEPRP